MMFKVEIKVDVEFELSFEGEVGREVRKWYFRLEKVNWKYRGVKGYGIFRKE